MSFAARMAVATPHEQAVFDRLAALGWMVEWWGQGQFKEATRETLKKLRTSLRWFPDMLAIKPGARPRFCFVDAKETLEENRNTGNYAIEEESLRAMELVAGITSIQAVYAMHDFRVLWTYEVRKHGRWLNGFHKGTGSGTPYFLVEAKHAWNFEKGFGG